jgi:ferredoxin-NADP reductase
MFYIDEIKDLKNRFNIFESHHYLSRENIPEFSYGYVIDWITPESILPYNEFYLCGSPAMVKSAREKLEALGIEKEKIFWEQF